METGEQALVHMSKNENLFSVLKKLQLKKTHPKTGPKPAKDINNDTNSYSLE